MAEYRLPFTAQEIEEKLTNMDGGIIDVAELPAVGDENTLYRVIRGTLYYNGIGQGTSYIVNELPAQGEPCTTDGENIAATYYSIDDKVLYGYVPGEVGAALGVQEGWYPVATLLSALGHNYGGEITNPLDMAEETIYFLMKYIYYTYKDGLWTPLNKYQVYILGQLSSGNTPISGSDYLAITEDFFNTELYILTGDMNINSLAKLPPVEYFWTGSGAVYRYSVVKYDSVDGGLISIEASVGIDSGSNEPVINIQRKTFFPGSL